MIKSSNQFCIYSTLFLFILGCDGLMNEYQDDDVGALAIDITICDILSNTENAINAIAFADDSLSLIALYDTLKIDTSSFISISNTSAWKLPLIADTCFFMVYAPQQADSYFVAINSSSGFSLYNSGGQSVESENEILTLTNVAGCPETRTRKAYSGLNGLYLARVINPNVSTLHMVFLNDNLPPKASFIVSSSNVSVGDTISFTDQSAKGSYPIISYLWDFGDGSSRSDSSFVRHAYVDSGKFSPSITVSDGYLSNTVTKTDFINVLGVGE
ncbi:MAG: hypothetical protein CMG74_01680 [Candidatus Marinimicrobia bacterium]|nr:hypothetical protein [Candidatus Neomarinimicrobiota bacterium]|tara:strand:- start:7690 stop:8505 length:816 start_codon:yes stop_codon:yes gene_type:complete